jgi:glycosyltransferase involved in cell wall biosynthesis
LYLQASTRDGILFSRELCEYLKIPVVIHIMDDWPSTISNRGLFKDFWHKKIDREFKQLLKGINLHLSISDAMSEEYNRRYQLKFIAFHNPIEIKSWLPYIKTDFTIDKNHISVLYSGRLGDLGISNSLVEIASAIDSMEKNEYNIKLHIQTPTDKQSILNQLRKFKCVVVNPFVEYSEIPRVFSSVDILLLANDFSKQGIDYLRFSMPTKASEYMISGTPIMVYSAEETAVSKFFTRNDCGYCVTRQGSEEIIKALRFLIINEEYRRKISRNAVQLAKDRFDSVKVRSEFQNLLINLHKKDNYVH